MHVIPAKINSFSKLSFFLRLQRKRTTLCVPVWEVESETKRTHFPCRFFPLPATTNHAYEICLCDCVKPTCISRVEPRLIVQCSNRLEAYTHCKYFLRRVLFYSRCACVYISFFLLSFGNLLYRGFFERFYFSMAYNIQFWTGFIWQNRFY